MASSLSSLPSVPSLPNIASLKPHLSLPICPSPPKFIPKLLPENTRSLVLAPLWLVRKFLSYVFIFLMAATFLIFLCLSSIPIQFLFFIGFPLQLLCALIIILCCIPPIVMLEFSRRKADKQLAGLEKLCVGDVAQAAMLAKSLVPRSARALQKENRKKVYRQLKDGANTGADVLSKTSVAANKAAKQGAAYSKRAALQASDLAMTKGTEFASAASSSASLAAENIAKETDYLLKNPKDGFGSLAKSTRKKVKKTAGKTKKSLQNVKNMMEKNPLYIFEKVLSRLFRSALVVIILSPVILFLLGFGLWKLGVVVNGLEFMTFGVLMAVVLPLLWYFVKHRVMDQLSGPVKEAVMKEMKKAKKVAKKVVPKGAMLTASASMSKIKNNLGGTLGGTLGSTLGAVNVRNINLARSKFSKFPRFGAPLSRRPNDENV